MSPARSAVFALRLRWAAAALLGLLPAVRAAETSAPPPVYIDVRTTEEFAADHVAGALHLPYRSIGRTIERAVPDRSAPIVLYCAVGGRAGVALRTLRRMGYRNAVNGGGFEDLKKRGVPVGP